MQVAGDPDGNNGLYYLHSDHPSATLRTSLGSASSMSDTAGQRVGEITRDTPFGETRTSNGNEGITDMGFTGHKHNDNIGLVYMNARFYVPSIGRFASADSIVPDPTNPQAYNRYSYVYNRPVIFNDPSGHLANCDLLGGSSDISACQVNSTTSSYPETITLEISNDILAPFGITQKSFEIEVHIDGDPMNPNLFDYEIAAYSLMNEQEGLHPSKSVYDDYPRWRKFFEKFTFVDAIGIVVAMRNRNDPDLYIGVIQNLESAQFAYSEEQWDRGSIVFQDYLLIAYIVLETSLVPDILDSRAYYYHEDTDLDVRNDQNIYPNQDSCCLDRTRFYDDYSAPLNSPTKRYLYLDPNEVAQQIAGK